MKITNLLPKHYLEHGYFDKMFQSLDRSVFHNKHVIVSNSKSDLPEYGSNVVVILTACDETVSPPKYKDKVQVVFKHHFDKDHIGNVYHIPLPYPTGFSGNAKIPIEKRKYDVFFAGCRRGSRKLFEANVRKLKNNNKFNCCIKLTNKFMTGYSLKEYSDIMSDSKIVLNPRGWKRPECIRFTEAIRCGCEIISDPHPEFGPFERCPAVYIKDWNELIPKVESILNGDLKAIHEKIKISWDIDFSPQAVAKRINQIVRNTNG